MKKYRLSFEFIGFLMFIVVFYRAMGWLKLVYIHPVTLCLLLEFPYFLLGCKLSVFFNPDKELISNRGMGIVLGISLFFMLYHAVSPLCPFLPQDSWLMNPNLLYAGSVCAGLFSCVLLRQVRLHG